MGGTTTGRARDGLRLAAALLGVLAAGGAMALAVVLTAAAPGPATPAGPVPQVAGVAFGQAAGDPAVPLVRASDDTPARPGLVPGAARALLERPAMPLGLLAFVIAFLVVTSHLAGRERAFARARFGDGEGDALGFSPRVGTPAHR